MTFKRPVLGAAVLITGLAGLADYAAAGGPGPGYPVSERWIEPGVGSARGANTIWRYRSYGRPGYGCWYFGYPCAYRWFGTGERHYRRVRYFSPPRSGPRANIVSWRDTPRVRPGRHGAGYKEITVGPAPGAGAADRRIYDGRTVTVLQPSGEFTRIAAPGQATRWVRSEALLPGK